jgi:hypothetical protein
MTDYTKAYTGGTKKLSKLAWVVIFVAILIIIALGFVLKNKFSNNSIVDVDKSAYQAVFLSNGQVYFGSISKMDKDFITIKDVYYLQAVQSLQGSTAQNQPFSLVKLGKELHGPTDTMYINRSQVLFYENMKDDSSVVKSINDYKKGTSN